jgi:hypothetical protein
MASALYTISFTAPTTSTKPSNSALGGALEVLFSLRAGQLASLTSAGGTAVGNPAVCQIYTVSFLVPWGTLKPADTALSAVLATQYGTVVGNVKALTFAGPQSVDDGPASPGTDESPEQKGGE